jgi:hypothetical protein
VALTISLGFGSFLLKLKIDAMNNLLNYKLETKFVLVFVMFCTCLQPTLLVGTEDPPCLFRHKKQKLAIGGEYCGTVVSGVLKFKFCI